MENESEYFLSLSAESKKRYRCKVTSSGLKVDPYSILSWTEDPSILPNVQWSDMVMYMVSTPSPYTRDEIKAWKGMLDGGNFVKSGWVHSLKLHQFKGSDGWNFVIMGKVKHSQRMSASMLLPWVIVTEQGQVLAAHCTCMAGLGEACSHISAVLSCLIQATEAKERSGEDSCTSRQCSWLPTARDVAPATIKNIVFKRKTTSSDSDVEAACCSSEYMGTAKKTKLEPPTEAELADFFSAINKAGKKPAILKITDPYYKHFIPTLSKPEFPKPITELYDPTALTMSYPVLLKESEKVFDSVKVTIEEAKKVEEETRKQCYDKTWFVHRAGRITASNFKSVCHTNLCMPSQSLIQRICHPELHRFSTEATKWGVDHESTAIDQYLVKVKENHDGLQITKAGLFIDPDRPYIAATPDGIIQCDCCGKGAVEVKCPFNYKDSLPDDDEANFCMMRQDGNWMLKRDHAYYYQVQLQLHVCRFSYGDFVLWSQNGILAERIYINTQFLDSKMDIVRHFFVYAILPEIVGKWYSRRPVADTDGIVDISDPQQSTAADEKEQEDDPDKPWCYCGQPSYGEMILCDNKTCTIQWFHFDCLHLRNAPKGKWYCPSCAKLPKYKKKS